MRAILLPLVLTACGTAKSSEQTAPAPATVPAVVDPATPVTTLPAQAAAPTTLPTAQPATVTKPSLLSLAVPAASDLPVCNADNNQQLVYVLAVKQFQTCQSGAWVKIDITAPVPVVVPPSSEAMWQTVAAVELGAKWLAIKDQIGPLMDAPQNLPVVASTPCTDRRPNETTYTRYVTKDAAVGFVVLNVLAGVVVKIDKQHTDRDLSITSATGGECQLYFP